MRNYQLAVNPSSYIKVLKLLYEGGITTESIYENHKSYFNSSKFPDLPTPFKNIDKYIQRFQSDESYTPNFPFKSGNLITVNRASLLYLNNGQSISVETIFRTFSVYFKIVLPALSYNYFPEDDSITLSVRPAELSSNKTICFHFNMIISAVYWSLHDIFGGNIPCFKAYLPSILKFHGGYYNQLDNFEYEFCQSDIPALRISFTRNIDFSSSKNVKTTYESRYRYNNSISSVRHCNRGIFSDWVCEMLKEPIGHIPTLTELASALNLSVRSLERYLKEEGVSFRDLSSEFKNKRAIMLLKSDTKMSDIAKQLGYSNSGSFARSFKKINNMLPSVFKDKVLNIK